MQEKSTEKVEERVGEAGPKDEAGKALHPRKQAKAFTRA